MCQMELQRSFRGKEKQKCKLSYFNSISSGENNPDVIKWSFQPKLQGNPLALLKSFQVKLKMRSFSEFVSPMKLFGEYEDNF